MPNPKMVRIAAGEFLMGCNREIDKQCASNEPKLHKASTQGFWIDVHEVTVQDYERCVEAKACPQPVSLPRCNHRQGRLLHPINCVTWFGARDFCRWLGRRLPTEIEWERAARGTDGALYPWGEEPPSCLHAVFNEQRQPDTHGCNEGTTAPVGSRSPRGDSAEGVQDLLGNLQEWTQTRGAQDHSLRVIRGGSWGSVPAVMRASKRQEIRTDAHQKWGFRCVADL